MSRILFFLLLILSASTLPACQAARTNFFKSEIGDVVPLPPDGEALNVNVDPKYTTASLNVKFQSQKPPAEIVTYYQHELAIRGFSLIEKYSYGDTLPASPDASPATSPASPQSPWSHDYEFKRGNDVFWSDSIQFYISWRSAAGPCDVSIILRHNSYLGEFAKFPVALPVSVVFLPLLPWGEGYAVVVYDLTSSLVDTLY